MKKVLLLLGILLAFGALKAPAEHALLLRQRALGFQMARLNLNVRAQLGQTGFVAALSGFRALMADILWIRAGVAFDQMAWPRMQLLLHSATQLQPKAELFWEMAHFHMAYDAATAVRSDEKREPLAALRRKAEVEYMHIGEVFLKDGLTFNPESSRLWERLGTLYGNRLHDHSAAAEAFLKASQKPNAMTYLRRFVGYELAQIPGREREAYEALRKLYLEGDAQRLPNLLRYVSQLEQKLAVPTAERVYIPRTADEPAQPQVNR